MPETAVGLPLDEGEPGLHVDLPRRREDVVRPEGDLPVAGLTGESDALVDEARSEAHPSRFRLYEEKPELRLFLPRRDEEDAPQELPAALRDEAAFPPGILRLEEPAGDLGDESLEGLVPTVLLSVEGPVAVDDPSDVSGAVGADE